MNRRLQTILLPLAVASVAAGCTTFTDDDLVARVGDAELTDTDVRDLATEAGFPAEEELDLATARTIVGNWVNETAFESEVDDPTAFADDRVAGLYDDGVRSAGITCPAFLVTETLEQADAAAAELRDGADFADVFAANNIDQSLDPTTGLIGCPSLAGILGASDAPEAEVLLELDADERYGTAELFGEFPDEPIAAILIEFRSFDEVDAESVPLVDATVRSVLAIEDVDVMVNSRYGTFDPASGTVLPLG